MGRPTAERVEAIEAQILDAARNHFLESGFESTSMEAIALSAGVSKGTLYARYPNKTALLRAVYVRHSTEWVRNQWRLMGALPEDHTERLKLHARRIIESLGSEEVRAFRQLVRGAGAPDADVAKVLFEVGYLPSVDDIGDEFDRAGKQLGHRPANPRRVAEMFISTLLGWHASLEFRGLAPDAKQEAEFADHMVAVMLAGAAAW